MPKRLHPMVKAYKALPIEAKFQLDNVMTDDKLEIEQLNIDYIAVDILYSIDRLDDGSWDDERSMATRQQNAIRRWIKKFAPEYDGKSWEEACAMNRDKEWYNNPEAMRRNYSEH